MAFIQTLTYRLLWWLLWLPLLLWLSVPRQGRATAGARWREYLGGGERWLHDSTDGPLWLHAASVGEVNAVAPLLRLLRQQYPRLPLLVTTMTATGAARLDALFGHDIEHRYMPFDMRWCIRRFLRRYNPAACVLVEMELWPVWLRQMQLDDLPVCLINGRLSQRTVRGYARFRPLLAPVLAHIELAMMQTRADAQRLRWLGAPRVEALGNLKYDLEPPANLEDQLSQLRAQLGRRPIWLAASTQAEEEKRLMELQRQLLQQLPHALLILMPRHPQRFDDVARQIDAFGVGWQRRSHAPLAPVAETNSVYLADTMGELVAFAAVADVAVMGGTLRPLGGQNPLELAVVGTPVLVGPSVYNFRDAVSRLLQAGGARQAHDDQQLLQALQEWLQHPQLAQAAGAAAQQVVKKNRGAVAATFHLLEQVLLRACAI